MAGRLVHVNGVQPHHLQGLVYMLEASGVCSELCVAEGFGVGSDRHSASSAELQQRRTMKVTFKVISANLNTVAKLLNHGTVQGFFTTFDVLTLCATTEALPRTARRHKRLCPSNQDRLSTLELHQTIVGASHLNFDHCMLIVVASGISAVGLLTDSSVDILASFFISPLMSMILAATWGAVIRDGALFCRSWRNTLCGACICWVSGALIGVGLVAYNDPQNLAGDIADNSGNSSAFYAISINAVQITSRGPPAFANLVSTGVIAAFSGVGIALGFSGGISSALSGVALSASLLPPVVNSGLMFTLGCAYPDMKTEHGYNLHQVSYVSFCIYALTVSLLALMACITFKLKHIGGQSIRIVGRHPPPVESTLTPAPGYAPRSLAVDGPKFMTSLPPFMEPLLDHSKHVMHSGSPTGTSSTE